MMTNLKKHVCTLVLAFSVIAPMSARSEAALESDPAYLPIDKALDLKVIRPEVNVNLPRFLLRDAVSELKGGTNDTFAAAGIDLADLVKDVKLIRVVVVEANKTNRAALASGIATLRNILDSKWTPIAVVPGDNVGVYALGDAAGESMVGLALLIHDGDDAVIANVVGRVSLGKIVKAASNFDKFPKDLLKKLSATGGGGKEAKGEAGGGAGAGTGSSSGKAAQ